MRRLNGQEVAGMQPSQTQADDQFFKALLLDDYAAKTLQTVFYTP
jgi:hypothetical protein